ncbi:MAG: SpoIIE family protein phosphatase [Oscillochloris sp.]|nr:SpoIIE family protein phosphatase [Oscillochloris sp.]
MQLTLDIHVAIAKIAHHGGESGDTLETIERPGGGFSFVLVDGQGTGRGAKTLSNLVATRAISLLKDGARDGAVARAVHDYLYTYRMGQAVATLNIISVDFQSGRILVSRNNPAPFFVIDRRGLRSFNEPSTPIGLQPMVKPIITELTVEPFMYVVVFTDGLLRAGERYDEDLALVNYLSGWPAEEGLAPDELSERLLQRAIELDRDEPSDDMSVLTLAVLPAEDAPAVRRMYVSSRFETTGRPPYPAADDDLADG